MTGWTRIAAGYAAALAVTAVLLTLLMAYTLGFFSDREYGIADYAHAALVLAGWAVAVTIIPCLIFVYLAEQRRWRNILSYEIFGAVLPLPLTYRFDAGFIVQCCAIGAAAGTVYWWIAGRRAGD